jgi:hypothetical protein
MRDPLPALATDSSRCSEVDPCNLAHATAVYRTESIANAIAY